MQSRTINATFINNAKAESKILSPKCDTGKWVKLEKFMNSVLTFHRIYIRHVFTGLWNCVAVPAVHIRMFIGHKTSSWSVTHATLNVTSSCKCVNKFMAVFSFRPVSNLRLFLLSSVISLTWCRVVTYGHVTARCDVGLTARCDVGLRDGAAWRIVTWSYELDRTHMVGLVLQLSLPLLALTLIPHHCRRLRRKEQLQLELQCTLPHHTSHRTFINDPRSNDAFHPSIPMPQSHFKSHFTSVEWCLVDRTLSALFLICRHRKHRISSSHHAAKWAENWKLYLEKTSFTRGINSRSYRSDTFHFGKCIFFPSSIDVSAQIIVVRVYSRSKQKYTDSD